MYSNSKKILLVFLALTAVCLGGMVSGAFAQSAPSAQTLAKKNPQLSLSQKDLAVSPRYNEKGERTGVDLFIRKKSAVQSVMLVETTKDPAGKEDNYAYRALEYNTTNGNEVRYLNGEPLVSEHAKFSLISSTAEKHPSLGPSFHIYIPNTIQYGYPWTRHGTVTLGKGTFVNIRTFTAKYGDYTGDYQDNPFMFDFVPVPRKDPPEIEPVVLTDAYNSRAAESFAEIASDSEGKIIYSKGPESLPQDIEESLERIDKKEKVDVVFCIDTTGSMKDDMDTLRNEWIPRLTQQLSSFGDVRMGVIFYRDYTDSYSFKGLPVKYFEFTRYPSQISKYLDTAVIRGNEGGDVPEAVYEALYAAETYYVWRKDAVKKIILIGDAEPHPKPRGSKKMTRSFVMGLANEKGIKVDCIIVPDDR